nr:unnamed protein product [Callosobruchus chinensis]
MWIPSHIGIRENERADQAAREASNSVDKDDDIPTPYKDIVSYIKCRVLQVWQHEWDQYTGHVKQIKPSILKQIYPKGLSRKEQVLLCRLRIGHTNVTHAHLLNRNPTPRSLRCNEVLTVEHILTYCTEYQHIRNSLHISTNINTSLSTSLTSVKTLISFLKETYLYNKI